MKGDFSRVTFDETNRYSRVLMQQGRVLLDADWNESAEIQLHDLRSLARDLIGPHGAPAGEDGADGTGFSVGKLSDAKGAEVKNDFAVAPGRYYVQGIRCDNPAAPVCSYRAQPDLPDDGVPFESAKAYLAYLDVWERHITDTEALTSIDEPALGRADTCTRSRIVWQVRTRILDPAPATPQDLRETYQKFLDALKLGKPGALAARVDKPAEPDSPCLVAPEARFRGTENQLYRVEIHKGGARPTFVWSRENGSEIYAVDNVSGNTITLRGIGLDDRSSLEPDDMVELVDDTYTLLSQAEPLMRVVTVDRENNQVTVDPAPTRNTGTHRYLRRWDSGEIEIAAASAAADKGWINLEDGVQVKFDPPDSPFETGQYWTIPARTATGDVIWPQNSGKPAFRPPQGVEHDYAPLALVNFKPDRSIDTIVDLRRKLARAWK